MSEYDFYFFDPEQPVTHLCGNLPHWRQAGTRYFVTFRLADAIPQGKLRQWQEQKAHWLRRNPPPHTEEQSRAFWCLFPERMHKWLDAGYGSCALGDTSIAAVVESSMRHFAGKRFELGEHVVMPNHVHAVVAPFPGVKLSDILHTWKGYSATKINVLLGRKGNLWQHESFDHIVRSPRQLEKINQYIRDNPKMAGLA